MDGEKIPWHKRVTQHKQTSLRDEVNQITAQSGTLRDVQRRLYRWNLRFRDAKSSHNPFQCRRVDSLEGGVGPRDEHIEIRPRKRHAAEEAGALELIKTNWVTGAADGGKKLIPYDDIHSQGIFVPADIPCSQCLV